MVKLWSFKNQFTTALDSIKANLLRSLLTTIAIVIGTASVIAMVGIGSSAQRAIDDSITNSSARTLVVYTHPEEEGRKKLALRHFRSQMQML